MTAEPVEIPCRARSLSVEPGCLCPTCMPKRRLAQKMRRCGIHRPDLSVQGWAALDRMLTAGRSISDIAATAGMNRRDLTAMLYARKQRGTRRITYGRALALIEAESKPAAGGLVVAVGARRRLQALAVLGWRNVDIAERTGLDVSVVQAVQAGRVLRTSAATFAAIARVYRQIGDERGPSTAVSARSTNRGWAPPAAWDDVDDLTERPKGLGGPPKRRKEATS